jgi:hypothetical protein
LESARQTHGSADYERLAAPYLLQIQERQQEVLSFRRFENSRNVEVSRIRFRG